MTLNLDANDRLKVTTIAGLAELVNKNMRVAQDEGGALYHYTGGVYQVGGENQIQVVLKNILIELQQTGEWTRDKAGGVVEYIRVGAPKLWEKPPLNCLNCRNGLVRLDGTGLIPHSWEWLSQVQLGANYDPKAKCPAWDKFLEEVVGDDKEAVWDLIAWLILPIKIQRAVFFVGEGANGKSTLLNAIISLLGSKNVSGVPLHKLEDDRFSAAQLIGKLANICPDIPNRKLTGSSIFKSITGGDMIMAEYKYRNSFPLRPFSRLIFSCNDMPESPDNSDGWFRRIIILPFTQTFTDSPSTGENLSKYLSHPQEISGVLNRALRNLSDVQQRGLTVTANMESMMTLYRRATDPIIPWLETMTESGDGYFIPIQELYKSFTDYCRIKQLQPPSDVRFGRAIGRVWPTVQIRQSRINGERIRLYFGIRLKPIDLHF